MLELDIRAGTLRARRRRGATLTRGSGPHRHATGPGLEPGRSGLATRAN